MQGEGDITHFAQTNSRNKRRVFGIRRADRRAHMYLIGRTGVGKSTLLETLIQQDIRAGEGFALFDPHGELASRVYASLPESCARATVYLNLPNPSLDVYFNPLEDVPVERRPLAAANLVELFRKTWADTWGPRLEHVLRNAFLALLDHPGGTLADIPRLFGDKKFRLIVAARLENEQVKAFWLGEYERYPPAMRAQVTAPVE